MGDPVERGAETRTKTRELAAAIVQSVIDDERMPHGLAITDTALAGRAKFYADDVESLLTELAQEIVALVDERRAFIATSTEIPRTT